MSHMSDAEQPVRKLSFYSTQSAKDGFLKWRVSLPTSQLQGVNALSHDIHYIPYWTPLPPMHSLIPPTGSCVRSKPRNLEFSHFCNLHTFRKQFDLAQISTFSQKSEAFYELMHGLDSDQQNFQTVAQQQNQTRDAMCPRYMYIITAI